MRTLALFSMAASFCWAFPHLNLDQQPDSPAKRFANLPTGEELKIVNPPTKPAVPKPGKQSTLARPTLPTYPKTVTNPVDPNSWLMQYARSEKVSPYWKFTETLWAPCQRHRQPIPDPTSCKPTCEDVHSHTQLSIFAECSIDLYARICTFATFVLPDSECPGRPNSYQLRCPTSLEQLNKILYDGFEQPYIYFSQLTEAIEVGTHIGPTQCPQNKTEPVFSANRRHRRQLDSASHASPTHTKTASSIDSHNKHHLLKRDYQYRRYLNSKGLYRTYSIEGPRQELPNGHSEGIESLKRPWNCYDSEIMIQSERMYINDTQIEICWYPERTRNKPEERCPGIKTPDSCPKDDDELVETIRRYYSDRSWEPVNMTVEAVREMIEVEIAEEKPPCDVTDRCCIGPHSEVNGCTPRDWGSGPE
ncbi:hypothetical protein BJ508DRAFT_360800 [Ascobolus immersus RN42]|uniref:Extracellular membrane protein CFEM domain-containing protein n=1 Tax=Ascobolus immersus RN42 TaxID=1160509 RepID=A0A3N4I9Q7_ASCIM|nr:hypothetical protein BJ508DRAFT_360800 [Ascobolus immersus RN42]